MSRVHPTGVLVYSSNRAITPEGVPAPILKRFLKKEVRRLELAVAAHDAEIAQSDAAGDAEGAGKARAEKEALESDMEAAIDLSMDLEMEYAYVESYVILQL